MTCWDFVSAVFTCWLRITIQACNSSQITKAMIRCLNMDVMSAWYTYHARVRMHNLCVKETTYGWAEVRFVDTNNEKTEHGKSIPEVWTSKKLTHPTGYGHSVKNGLIILACPDVWTGLLWPTCAEPSHTRIYSSASGVSEGVWRDSAWPASESTHDLCVACNVSMWYSSAQVLLSG